MTRQFLLDMIIGWILYTKEGKNTANNIVNKAVNIAKNNLQKNNVEYLKNNKNILKQPTMDDKNCPNIN